MEDQSASPPGSKSAYSPPGWTKEWNDIVFSKSLPKMFAKRNRSDVTLSTCIQLAGEVLEADDIQPVGVQGSGSFTFVSQTKQKVLQIRKKEVPEDLLDLILTIYGELTPKVRRCRCEVVKDFPLPIYISDMAKGVQMVCLPIPRFSFEGLCRCMVDIADFITRPVHVDDVRQKMLSEGGCTAKAEWLIDSVLSKPAMEKHLPELLDKIRAIRPSLHHLEKLPLVLTHTDLATMNMFANPETGELTGVIDWDDARIEVFGTNLWCIYEDLLTKGDEDGFEVNPERETVERVFWDRLWLSLAPKLTRERDGEAVRTALWVGAVWRYLKLDVLDRIGVGVDEDQSLIRARYFLPLYPDIHEEESPKQLI